MQLFSIYDPPSPLLVKKNGLVRPSLSEGKAVRPHGRELCESQMFRDGGFELLLHGEITDFLNKPLMVATCYLLLAAYYFSAIHCQKMRSCGCARALVPYGLLVAVCFWLARLA